MKTGVAVLVLSAMLTGCGPDRFEMFDSEGGASAHMDASRRLLLVTNHGGRDGNRRVVCAEPSPDSIVSSSAALSSAIDASVPVEDKTVAAKAALAAVTAQNSAYIGMRSQTIQLLRDGLYRACEAYANGAIDEQEYNMLLISMPRVMTALLAIDGLTGHPIAPPMVLPAPTVDLSSTLPEDSKVAAAVKVQESAALSDIAKAAQEQAKAQQTQAKADAAIAKEVTAIAKGVNAHPTMPAVCLSLLGNPDRPAGSSYDPGYQAVLAFCRKSFATAGRI